MKIETPGGVIETIKCNDPNYPGIWIRVNGIDLVLVEYDQGSKKHVIRAWDAKDPDGDRVYKQIIDGGNTDGN